MPRISSCHSGLIFSIKSIFHWRGQRFSAFSRWIASRMSKYSSYQTRRWTP